MIFELSYELDYKRVISAVINDSRAVIPALAGEDGNGVYAYAQAQIALIVPGVLLYRISTAEGNLGGYLGLQVANGVASILLMQLRPAFVPLFDEISQVIATFITSNDFLQDMIY